MFRQLSATAVAAAAFLALSAASSSAQTTKSQAVSRKAPDESALRYYASLGQSERVAAEIRRLSRLDPTWHAPTDLASTKPGRADEGPLWDLFASRDFAALDAAIVQRETAEPGWHPSDDLRDKIKQTTLRALVTRLAEAGDWRGIVAAIKTNGSAWAAKDAEALWMIGEAYAREHDCAEAYVVYHSILAGHEDPRERVATIERAIATVPMTYVEKLIAMGTVGTDGRGEFDAIGLDITRARLGAFLHDEPARSASARDLEAFGAFARDAEDPNQAALLAWYAFKRGVYADALSWFKLSIGRGGDAMVAHGLAHTLRKLGMKREAEEVAYAWREPLVNNAILFIDILEEDFTRDTPPYIEPARVARYAQVTMATGSGEGAQALAWYAYNTCQYPLALEWFQRAVAWLPKEATAYGYALTLQRLKRVREFRAIVNRYDGLFPRVVALAFDDGRQRPPPPCEANLAMPSAPPRDAETPGARFGEPALTMADTPRPIAVSADRRTPARMLALRYARARVPSPSAPLDQTRATLVKKTDFPFAVGMENPLRFSALVTVASEDRGGLDRGGLDRGGLDREAPLVARRVPGVGAMPYERFGFTLRPAWDGTTGPSTPTAEHLAPLGTLWAETEDSRAADGRARATDDQPITLGQR